MKNASRIAFIALAILSLTISACNLQADGTFGNITGPQGPTGPAGTNGTTNLDQAVANSNLTGTTGYRLTWNGTNTIFLPPSFGGSLTYYLNSNNASDVATYFSLLDTVHNVTHNTSAVVNVGNTTVANFITQANNPGITFIPAGSYDTHIHLSVTGSKPTYVFAEIWETSSNGTDIAKIGTTENTPILTSTKTEYDIVFVDDNVYTLNSTASRIDLRVIATATAGSATSVFIYCGGTDDSHISLPGTQVTINNFVPYTGAINPLDMGAHNMTTTGNISSGNIFLNTIGSVYQYLVNLSGNISLKLDAANVTNTPAANKTPQADANATVDKWNTRFYDIKLIADNTSLFVDNPSSVFWTVPAEFDGFKVVSVAAFVYGNSSSGLPTFGLFNIAKNVSICSTNITIDVGENTSYTATTAPVINTSNNTLNVGDQVRFDTRVAGTGTKGGEITIGFRYP